MSKPRRVAIYLRVSTDDQTTENQRRDLMAVAERAGWQVVKVYEDHGISGSKGRDKRPALDAMLKAVAQRKVDMVAAWSVDRLSRSLGDLCAMLTEVHAVGCGLYLHQQALDTTTPAGRAMFQMMGVFAEFERSMIQERVKAGMQRARAEGKQIGRPRHGDEKAELLRAALAAGDTMVEAARKAGLSRSSAFRLRDQIALDDGAAPVAQMDE